MMNAKQLLKKVRSRLVYIKWKIQYYLSNSSKKIKTLKNKHSGERCFIIGNGPSLTPEDLNLIKDETTFASHRIFNIFELTEWRPTYYIGQDVTLLKEISQHAKNVVADYKFLTIQVQDIYKSIFNDAIYFFLRSTNFYPNLPKFSTDASRQLYEGYSVTYGAIQLAVYMGFKEIYLLGVDFNYSLTVDHGGKITKTDGVKDYFSNDNNIGLNLPNLELSLLGFQAAEKFAKENGFSIKNATRGGKLEVFKRVRLEDIVSNKDNCEKLAAVE